MSRLFHLFLVEHAKRRHDQNANIQCRRPVFDVIQVIRNPLFNGGVAPQTVYLRPAGNSRAYLMLDHVAGNLFFELLHKEGQLRPRADQAHVALEHIEKLRQLVHGAFADQLVFRIKAVLASKCNKYILLNAPEKSLDLICSLLPGMKSPTIIPLREKGWVSVHSVVNENAFWEVIGRLKDAGAACILIVPIEKMIL